MLWWLVRWGTEESQFPFTSKGKRPVKRPWAVHWPNMANLFQQCSKMPDFETNVHRIQNKLLTTACATSLSPRLKKPTANWIHHFDWLRSSTGQILLLGPQPIFINVSVDNRTMTSSTWSCCCADSAANQKAQNDLTHTKGHICLCCTHKYLQSHWGWIAH